MDARCSDAERKWLYAQCLQVGTEIDQLETELAELQKLQAGLPDLRIPIPAFMKFKATKDKNVNDFKTGIVEGLIRDINAKIVKEGEHKAETSGVDPKFPNLYDFMSRGTKPEYIWELFKTGHPNIYLMFYASTPAQVAVADAKKQACWKDIELKTLKRDDDTNALTRNAATVRSLMDTFYAQSKK